MAKDSMGSIDKAAKDAGYTNVNKKGARDGMTTNASKLDKEIKSVAGKDGAQYADVNKQPKQMGG